MTESSQVQSVALLSSVFFPSQGGVQVGLHNIAMRLKSRGIEPVCVVPFGSRQFVHSTRLPYRVHVLPPKFFGLYRVLPRFIADTLYAWYYGALQRKFQFDYWHITMGYPAGVSFMPFAKRSKIPYLIRCAGSDIQRCTSIGYGARNSARIDDLVKQRLPACPRLIAISASVEAEYAEIGVPAQSVYNIPNGVDGARFTKPQHDRAHVCAQLNIPQHHKLLLAVGRNHPKKNFTQLVAIAEQLRAVRDDFTIIVVGDKSDEILVDAPATLHAHFRCLDGFGIDAASGAMSVPHRDLVSIYCASDIFVFPSLIETFGIVLVEAMAAGLPIVTSNGPGCRDLVTDGTHGFCCDPYDTQTFVERIVRLLTNPDLAARIGEGNRLAAQAYDWNAVVDQYVQLYNQPERVGA